MVGGRYWEVTWRSWLSSRGVYPNMALWYGSGVQPQICPRCTADEEAGTAMIWSLKVQWMQKSSDVKTLRHQPQLNTPKVFHVEMVRFFLASTATCWQPLLTATIQARCFAQRLSWNVRGRSGKRKAGAPIAKPMGSAISARSSRLRLALSSEWRLRLARVWAAPACGALARVHAPSTTQIFIQYRLGPCKTLLMSRCL